MSFNLSLINFKLENSVIDEQIDNKGCKDRVIRFIKAINEPIDK